MGRMSEPSWRKSAGLGIEGGWRVPVFLFFLDAYGETWMRSCGLVTAGAWWEAANS